MRPSPNRRRGVAAGVATHSPRDAAAPNAAVAVITAERGGFIPEGIEYDQANGRFLTGSLAEGSIFDIERDGRVVPFIRDADLVSSVGIEVDEPIEIACSSRTPIASRSTAERRGHAKLGVYHLTTGERLAMVDLGAAIAAPSASTSRTT